MLIEKSSIKKGCIGGKTILLTGSGGGIGFEAARTLAWLGAKVIIAEIDTGKGLDAERRINGEVGGSLAEFYEIDLSDESQIHQMAKYIKEKYGFLDVLFNNATITAFGNVEEVDIKTWDKSYAVNFRAPLLLTQIFLPDMRARNTGTVVFVPSSGAAPYMGAYEVFKTSQVELCNTLTGELEGTNVSSFSIGPGLVRTETAQNGIKKVAGLMGMTEDEFYRMNENHILGVEEAGTGFALSVLYAQKYRGQEISSIQVLSDAGLLSESTSVQKEVLHSNLDELTTYVSKAAKTFEEQYQGWLERNLFERQWVMRDFKKSVGCSAEQFRDKFVQIGHSLQQKTNTGLSVYKADLQKLIGYYQHQNKLLQGYEKNPEKLKQNSDTILQWIKDVQKICECLD